MRLILLFYIFRVGNIRSPRSTSTIHDVFDSHIYRNQENSYDEKTNYKILRFSELG